jgi:hypothetical protein
MAPPQISVDASRMNGTAMRMDLSFDGGRYKPASTAARAALDLRHA